MSRMRSVSAPEVADLADRLGLALAEGEAEDATERIAALSGLFERLGSTATPAEGAGGDRFEPGRYHPGEEADPHNAWLARFDLWRDSTGVLDGLDVAVKDNTCVRGVELTNGSRAFEGCVPRSHATVVERLLDAGGRIVGKTNMDELAFGPTSETSAYGSTENPRVAGHVAGGSSGGSAAAVAAGEADLALGSDTGGSVRIPASYCGIVGLKPTYGRVPTDGFAHLAPSMDTIGTLARDVETAARGLDVIAGGGGDADDPGVDPSSLAVGVPERFFAEHVSGTVERAVRDAVAAFGDAGADVREVSIPTLEQSREAWWGIAPAEFAAEYATDGCGVGRRGRVEPSLAAATRRVRRATSRDLGASVKENLLLGAHLLETHGGAHYVRATNVRARLRGEFDDALAGVDVLAAPATPTPALEVGEFERGVTPVNWNTHPVNLAGHPAVSVPCGADDDGRPIGLQLIGPWSGEGRVIDVAATYERELAPA